jgi:NADH-quinone oxidoreductase subunit C
MSEDKKAGDQPESGESKTSEDMKEPEAKQGNESEKLSEAEVKPQGASEPKPAVEAVEPAPKVEAPDAQNAVKPSSELSEAAAEVGKLPPEAEASKSPLSADVQADVDSAAMKQAADPAAQTTSEPSDAPAAELQAQSDADKEAKAKAAAEARAARASARAAKAPEEGEAAAPKEPSPNQPILDRLVEILKEGAGDDAVEQAFINERDRHLPYVIIKNELWPHVAKIFREHEELQCNYLRNLSGVDQETHLEVAYHLLSLSTKKDYCVKVKTDREKPSIPSVAPIWETANWNEREVYDLFGIEFPGHPDLRRIMMPDDWVGHPLRKDYEPLDPEV